MKRNRNLLLFMVIFTAVMLTGCVNPKSEIDYLESKFK